MGYYNSPALKWYRTMYTIYEYLYIYSYDLKENAILYAHYTVGNLINRNRTLKPTIFA